MTAHSALGVLLECAAIATVVSCGVAFVALALALGTVRAVRDPSARADVAFLAAVMPSLIVIVALAAALAPTLAVALGLSAVDHCPEHLHHPHVCFVHFDGVRPAAAVLGACALAVFVVRGITLVARHVRTASSIAKIEALADVTTEGAFPLVRLPGAARVCHAVGPARRRVLVSQRLIDALSPPAWQAVRAHEEEHLRRRDPLAMVVVELALLLAPPFFASALGRSFRRAAEAACDAAAARSVGGGVAVAEGLLEAARVVGDRRLEMLGVAVPAAVTSSLEARVRELLEDRPSRARPSFGFAAVALLAVALGAVGVAYNATLHHALETLLFHLT